MDLRDRTNSTWVYFVVIRIQLQEERPFPLFRYHIGISTYFCVKCPILHQRNKRDCTLLLYVCQQSLLWQYGSAKVIKINQSLGILGNYLHLIFDFNKNLRQQRLKINQDNFLDLTDTERKRIN
jgi:hypothetical protein